MTDKDEVTMPGQPRMPPPSAPAPVRPPRSKASPTHTVESVELDRIDVGDNVRSEIERPALESLAATIADVGLLQPITVIRQPGGRFKLHVGFRRFNAFTLLAAKDDAYRAIPAIVLEKEPEARDAGLQQLIENVARVDLSPLDLAGGVAAYVGSQPEEAMSKEEKAAWSLERNAKIEKIAATFDWSARTVRKHLALWHSPAWFREFGRAVKAERRKVDEQGNPVLDAKTNKPVMETKRWPALQVAFLEKLLALLNHAEKADEAARNVDGSSKPKARAIVERLAVAAAEQQWSVQRLDKEIDAARAALDGTNAPPSREGKRPYEATETRLVLDLKLKEVLTAGDRAVIAPQATQLLISLGFNDVVINP